MMAHIVLKGTKTVCISELLILLVLFLDVEMAQRELFVSNGNKSKYTKSEHLERHVIILVKHFMIP